MVAAGWMTAGGGRTAVACALFLLVAYAFLPLKESKLQNKRQLYGMIAVSLAVAGFAAAMRIPALREFTVIAIGSTVFVVVRGFENLREGWRYDTALDEKEKAEREAARKALAQQPAPEVTKGTPANDDKAA
jgi:hypothetical protein